MTKREYKLTKKNVAHWAAHVNKLLDRDDLTEEEESDCEMRMAQCKIWAHQLRYGSHNFDVEKVNSGDMSATSGVSSAEEAGATAETA